MFVRSLSALSLLALCRPPEATLTDAAAQGSSRLRLWTFRNDVQSVTHARPTCWGTSRGLAAFEKSGWQA